MKHNVLTPRQSQVLSFIEDRINNSDFPPTISEIQSQFSFKSPNAVQEHLKALERKGRIRRNPNQWRGVELVTIKKKEENSHHTITIPLVGRVAAGLPILAQENVDGSITVDSSWIGREKRLFALRVQGNSMIKAGIFDGDIAIARQQVTAINGDIVIALLGEDATLKRFQRKQNVVMLKPENDTMQPLDVNKRSDFAILGKVIATLHRIENRNME